MSTLQELIASLAADGFSAEEGQQILNEAGGDIQAVADASGFTVDEVSSFIGDNNLQQPTVNNDSAPIDLSNLSGLLKYDPYDVPQQSASSPVTKKKKEKPNLAGTALDTYNTLNTVKNAGAVQAAVNAGDLAAGSLLLPGLNIFAGLVKLMGLFEGGGLQESEYTTEGAIELLKGEQERLSRQTESSTEDSEGAFANSEFMQAEIDNGIRALYGDLAEEKGVLEGGGFVRDEQGFLRDTDAGGYWILNDKGSLMRTTPPLVPVPMPEITAVLPSSGGGSASASSNASTASSDSSSSSPELGDWVYDADAGVFRQTGSQETIVPIDGDYSDGDTVSSDDIQNVFSRWGDQSADNASETPSDDADDVLDIVDVLTSGGGNNVSDGSSGDDLADGDSDLTDGDSDLTDGDLVDTGDSSSGIAGIPNVNVSLDIPVLDPTPDPEPTLDPDPDPGPEPDDGTGDGDGTGAGSGSGDGTGAGTRFIGMLGRPGAPVTQSIFQNEFDIDVRKSSLLNLAKYLV